MSDSPKNRSAVNGAAQRNQMIWVDVPCVRGRRFWLFHFPESCFPNPIPPSRLRNFFRRHTVGYRNFNMRSPPRTRGHTQATTGSGCSAQCPGGTISSNPRVYGEDGGTKSSAPAGHRGASIAWMLNAMSRLRLFGVTRKHYLSLRLYGQGESASSRQLWVQPLTFIRRC
jgi:hypothetical protein